MKLLAKSVNNVIHCQSCDCLYEYEDDDIVEIVCDGAQYSNACVPHKNYISYVECPQCHSHFEFYDYVVWEEEQ